MCQEIAIILTERACGERGIQPANTPTFSSIQLPLAWLKSCIKSGDTVGCHLTFNKQNYGGEDRVQRPDTTSKLCICFTLKLTRGAFSEAGLFKLKISKLISQLFGLRRFPPNHCKLSETQGGLSEITLTPITPTVMATNSVFSYCTGNKVSQ